MVAAGPEPLLYPLDLEGASADDYAEMAERIEAELGHLDGVRRGVPGRPGHLHADFHHDRMQSLDALLRAFVEQRRMKIAGEYKPCYRVIA